MLTPATPTDKLAARPRTSRRLGLALILIALTLALPASASASGSTRGWGGWAWQESRSYADLSGVAFADATHGWAVGATWDTATDAYEGAIIATIDGGANWSAQGAGTTRNLTAVACSEADHCWAVGWTYDALTDTNEGAILATTDGGANWSAQNPGTSAPLNAVAFPNASHGCAVGSNGTILTTTDGGATWSTQASGTTAELSGVAFSDADHGWAAGSTWVDDPIDDSDTGYWGTILATTDGGVTWSTQVSGVQAFFSGVAFPDAAHGWVAEFNGSIWATGDGGATWSTKDLEVINDPRGGHRWEHPTAVAFADATHGWVVGGEEIDHPGGPYPGDLILATTDGGATWKVQQRGGGSDQGMTAVAFADATHGWAVDAGGTILATSTGGEPPLTLKLSGLKHGAMKLGKRVTAKGMVTRSAVAGPAGDKVKLTVQKKKRTTWVRVKTVKRTIAADGTYTWKYRPAKKGAYRMLATVLMSVKQGTAGTGWRTFRVK